MKRQKNDNDMDDDLYSDLSTDDKLIKVIHTLNKIDDHLCDLAETAESIEEFLKLR